MKHDEYKLHVAVVEHLRRAFPTLLWTHCPNKPKDAQDGFFKKQMGVRPGVADLLFWWVDKSELPWNLLCGAIELKIGKGRQGNDQNRFASSFGDNGGFYAICKSVKDVHDTLIKWGLKPKCNSILEPDYATKEEKFERASEFYSPQTY